MNVHIKASNEIGHGVLREINRKRPACMKEAGKQQNATRQEKMKLSGKILFSALILLAAFRITVPFAVADNNKPALPGVTVTDKYPNGCVDCHKSLGDKDYRLKMGLAKIEGHTEMDTIVKNVPQDCMKCHKADSSTGYLGDIVHRDHYRNPSKNVFIIVYKGDCLNCHGIDPESGKTTLKDGPKNW